MPCTMQMYRKIVRSPWYYGFLSVLVQQQKKKNRNTMRKVILLVGQEVIIMSDIRNQCIFYTGI